jgi:hypothetical protein
MANTILSKSNTAKQPLELSNVIERYIIIIRRLYIVAEHLYSEIRDVEGILSRNPEDFLNPQCLEYQMKRFEQLHNEFAKITDTLQGVE